ncbi:hypothetical protein Tco_1085263 [Tanacetum coccineum]
MPKTESGAFKRMARENQMHERLVGSGVWKMDFSGKSSALIVVELENRMVKEDCIRGLGASPAQAIVCRLTITYLVIYLDGFQWQKFRYNLGRVGKSYGERRCIHFMKVKILPDNG